MSRYSKKPQTSRIYLIILAVLVLAGSIAGTLVEYQKSEDMSQERASLVETKETYEAKKNECSGAVLASNSILSSSGLTDCGNKLATETKLEIRPLSEIYYTYCGYTFGSAVTGCTNARTEKIYVCKPGTTVYDRRIAGFYRYFIRYNTFSYRCDDTANTIRHELLHVVYNRLSKSQQESVISKLAKYRAQYASELALYSYSERDDELFVRVGADGKSVDDIELINLYAQVNKSYLPAKQKYYEKLISEVNQAIAEIESEIATHSAWTIVFATLFTLDLTALIWLAVDYSKTKKPTSKSVLKPHLA